MSHVADMEIPILDLDILDRCLTHVGARLVRNVDRYKWYGTHVGDYPLPAGFKQEDLGKCDHVIRLNNATSETYEIGVVRRRDGQPGYQLLWDFWKGGYGLQEAIGENGEFLRQSYEMEAVKDALLGDGMRFDTMQKDEEGNILLTFLE